MLNLRVSSLLVMVCAWPLVAQDRIVLHAPGPDPRPWTSTLVWDVIPLGASSLFGTGEAQEPRKERKGAKQVREPGAVVEVHARFDEPGRVMQQLLELKYRPLFRQAFAAGVSSSETRQIMASFMAAAHSGKPFYAPEPGSVHYNALMPEELRLRNFQGVGGEHWRVTVGMERRPGLR